MRHSVVLLLVGLLTVGSPPATGASWAVSDAFAPPQAPTELLPVPKEVQWGRGEFSITPSTRIVVAADATADDLFAAEALNKELRARSGQGLDVIRDQAAGDLSGQIVLGDRGRIARLDRLGLPTTRLARPEEYMLAVTPTMIAVVGADRRGTFYGVQTLRQVLRPAPLGAGSLLAGSLATVREVSIRDWPDHAVRGIHVLLDDASAEFHTAVIDRILAPYKFNTLVVEIEDVQWDSGRPFWTPDPHGATKAQVRHLSLIHI